MNIKLAVINNSYFADFSVFSYFMIHMNFYNGEINMFFLRTWDSGGTSSQCDAVSREKNEVSQVAQWRHSHLFILALLLSEIPFKPSYIAATYPHGQIGFFCLVSICVWANGHTVVHTGKRKEGNLTLLKLWGQKAQREESEQVPSRRGGEHGGLGKAPW